MIKIDERAIRPEASAQFFAADDLAWTLQQDAQQLEGLLLYFDFDAALAQLACVEVNLEDAESSGLDFALRRLVILPLEQVSVGTGNHCHSALSQRKWCGPQRNTL
jgi:hypothetical protein